MARRKLDPAEMDPDELEESLEELGGNDDAILQDGERLRVPLYMRDGTINPNLTPTQRGKALQQTEDAVARRYGLTDGLQLHKPGFRRVTDAAALERTRQAYADVDAAEANAWRGRATEQRARPLAVHDATTVDARQAAYDEYDRDMANAWRNPR